MIDELRREKRDNARLKKQVEEQERTIDFFSVELQSALNNENHLRVFFEKLIRAGISNKFIHEKLNDHRHPFFSLKKNSEGVVVNALNEGASSSVVKCADIVIK